MQGAPESPRGLAVRSRLDISIGPVQGFVAQSRRTRDLWGSSYLLSFLAAHAMRGAEKAGGRIVQPIKEDDPLFRWVAGERVGEVPGIGTLPNHFVVETEDPPRELARAAVDAFGSAWSRVAEAVWDRFVGPASPSGDGTSRIWDRQVSGFWELIWTAGPLDGPQGLLARRKHWRTHQPADEPGDKCTIMHDLQELSGHVSRWRKQEQDEFWNRVDQRLGSLDRRDDERLCAIALIKRLFPGVASVALGWPVDASHWPSTVYVAAVPWIRRVVSSVPEQARAYSEAVERALKAAGQESPLSEQPARFGIDARAAGGFARLDANYFHRDYVRNESTCPLAGDPNAAAGDDLVRGLEELYGSRNGDGRLGPPPAFHALLLADGDRLGELLGEIGGDKVSRALSAFTGRVPGIVTRHDGATVYAGGDDVLALLPVTGALRCADALRGAYEQAFGAVSGNGGATLSAAVAFAHMRMPLGGVLREAHRLLDEEAKRANGRNSLAAAVLKPGGPYCQWVTTWIRPDGVPDGRVAALELLDGLVGRLGGAGREGWVSSSLLYRLRDLLVRLCGWNRWRPGEWGTLPRGLDVSAFLRAEIGHSLEVRSGQSAASETDDVARRMWELLQRSPNDRVTDACPPSNGDLTGEAPHVGIDALLLARFLAQPEQDR